MKTSKRHQGRRLDWRSACVVVLALAFATNARPQQTQTSPALSGIAHVAMRVANLDASREFYRRLGFEEAFAFDQGGSPTEAFFKVNDTQFIELYPRREPGQPVGFLHVCFQSQNLQALNEFYRSRGLKPTAVSRGGAGNLLFSMSGPGLENIEFTQYMPGSRHTNDIGKHLSERRIGKRIFAVGFPTDDVQGAVSFYKREMGFARGSEHGSALRVPGDSGEQIEILPVGGHRLRLVLETGNLNEAVRELRKLGIAIQRREGEIVIDDPDGNVIVLKAGTKTGTATWEQSGAMPNRYTRFSDGIAVD